MSLLPLAPPYCRDCERPIICQKYASPGVTRHAGRGLCYTCHWRRRRNGSFLDVPPLVHTRREVIADLELILDHTQPIAPQLRDAAPRLGMSVSAVNKAWQRHRRDQKETS